MKIACPHMRSEADAAGTEPAAVEQQPELVEAEGAPGGRRLFQKGHVKLDADLGQHATRGPKRKALFIVTAVATGLVVGYTLAHQLLFSAISQVTVAPSLRSPPPPPHGHPAPPPHGPPAPPQPSLSQSSPSQPPPQPHPIPPSEPPAPVQQTQCSPVPRQHITNLHSWYQDRDANEGDCAWLCTKKYQAWCTSSVFNAEGGGSCPLNECLQPVPDATWHAVTAMHCYTSHGALDLDSSSARQIDSLAACKAACLEVAGCEAISVFASTGRAGCFLKREVRLHECVPDRERDLYLYERSVNHRFRRALSASTGRRGTWIDILCC